MKSTSTGSRASTGGGAGLVRSTTLSTWTTSSFFVFESFSYSLAAYSPTERREPFALVGFNADHAIAVNPWRSAGRHWRRQLHGQWQRREIQTAFGPVRDSVFASVERALRFIGELIFAARAYGLRAVTDQLAISENTSAHHQYHRSGHTWARRTSQALSL